MDTPRMGVPDELAERMSMAEQHEYLRARFSRRSMIRGGAVTLGAVTGGAFVTGGTDVIKGNTVTKKLEIGGTAYPETEGVVYVTAGAAGRSLYAFTAPDSYEGHENEVESVASFINLKDGKQNETVTWSRVRYLNYSFLRVDVTPAPKGHYTTLKVQGIAETGNRIDHFTVARKAK